MLRVIILCSAVSLYCTAFSQSYDNNWVFGDSAGLNFSTGTPTSFASSIWTYEACASISDSKGNLLFYTNGERVWDRSHQLMPHGDSLHIGSQPFPHFGSSLTQGVLIIPRPDYANLYYIFQIQNYSPDNNYGIEYSIVDMNLNAGLGDISEKNIELFEIEVGEKMTAVKHANGRDWWLVARKWEEIGDDEFNLTFIMFLITPDGLEGPFYQDYGPDSYPDDPDHEWGQMLFSLDGEKMAYTRATELDIYSFDRCTGNFTSYFTISDIANFSAYGCSFSPDGSKLYVSGACNKELFQYCLTCDGEPIDSTKELVYSGPDGPYCIMQHQVGPDGKIYIAIIYQNIPSDIFTPKNQNLCVVNNPNELYPECDFDTNTISLGTRRVIAGLPNMVNYNLGPLEGSACDTLETAINDLIEENNINIYPNPAHDHVIIQSGSNTELIYALKNMQGQVISKNIFVKEVSVELKNYPAGIYMVEIMDTTGKMLHAEKIILQ